jgi:hypothetical protein
MAKQIRDVCGMKGEEKLWRIGRIYPVSAEPKKQAGELEFMDVWYPIALKSKRDE